MPLGCMPVKHRHAEVNWALLLGNAWQRQGCTMLGTSHLNTGNLVGIWQQMHGDFTSHIRRPEGAICCRKPGRRAAWGPNALPTRNV